MAIRKSKWARSTPEEAVFGQDNQQYAHFPGGLSETVNTKVQREGLQRKPCCTSGGFWVAREGQQRRGGFLMMGRCVQEDRLLRNRVFVRKILNFMDRQTYTTASQGSQRESRSQAKRQHSREIGVYMTEEVYSHSSWR